GEALDRRHSGRLDVLRRFEPVGEPSLARNCARNLEIRGVVAVLARDERVLARARGCEEVDTELAAHDAALGLHVICGEGAALEARPVASQSSTGVGTGISISWPPIAFISSRMICSIFRWTRQPRGRNVQTPALTWRMNPPRTSSLWLTASASAGSSRRV